jgi:divalent metal cation (Fe/Co/Zn/Cd) transporter
VIHVIADAAVSVLVIVGLLLARVFGWLWMDPLAEIVGACLIASCSLGRVRDTGAILPDMIPDRPMADNLRQTIGGCRRNRRPLSLAAGSGPPRGDSVRQHVPGAWTGLLSGEAGAVPLAVAPHHRGP